MFFPWSIKLTRMAKASSHKKNSGIPPELVDAVYLDKIPVI